MNEEPQAPTEGQPQEQAPSNEGQAQNQVPEKFKDKSPEEITKAYEELSKTIGKQGEELGKTRKEKEELAKQLENWNKLGQLIESDPELFKTLESRINGEPKQTQEQPKSDDVRDTVTGNIVKEFETKFGITNLAPDKATDLRTRIGREIAAMYDPEGKKDPSVLLAEIPLSKLAGVLERGYTLATVEDKEEQARRQGYIEARQNREGEFGTIPSTGVNINQKTLTPEEEKTARKLGISPEDYLKYK